MRAVVLFQPDHLLDLIVALEISHVADICPAERIDRLVVVAHRENRRFRARQQLEPAILQLVRVLELVNQDVAEALRIVRAQELVSRQ